MALTVTLTGVERSRRFNKWHYKAVPTGSSYTSGGDTVDLTAVTIPAGSAHPVPDFPPTVDQVSFDQGALDFADALWVKGTTLKNAKIKFLSAADTEISSYSAGMQAAQINFTITENRGISQ